jgi:hypothetical protein
MVGWYYEADPVTYYNYSDGLLAQDGMGEGASRNLFAVGLSFPLPVPKGSTIDDAIITVTAGGLQGISGDLSASISVEETDGASVDDYRDGNTVLPERSYYDDPLWPKWDISAPLTPEIQYSSCSIKNQVQHFIDGQSYEEGNYIGLMTEVTSTVQNVFVSWWDWAQDNGISAAKLTI